MREKFQNKYRLESIRLQKWNYTWGASYFITIVTKNRIPYFGEIVDGEMILSGIGKIVNEYWYDIPNHFSFVIIDEFIVMPDHIHGIITLKYSKYNPFHVETLHATSPKQFKSNPKFKETLHATSLRDIRINRRFSFISPKQGSLASVIRSFKSAVTISARKINPEFAWQTRYYEKVIRDQGSFDKIRNYIKNNPRNWGG